MPPIRILVDSLADDALINAQMTNAREIMRRLHPEHFHVSTFFEHEPDPLVRQRPNTRLIQLPRHLKTATILKEFVHGRHDLIFYLKPSPASRWYLQLRSLWGDKRSVIGSVEAQSDLRNHASIPEEYAEIWERTILRSDYLFSNAESVRKSLLAEYGRSSEVIPTGVDIHFFIPAWDRAANPRPQVLFVGSLFPGKQPQMVLQAAQKFPAADFVIAGTGELAEELTRGVHQNGLKNVRLAGIMDRDTVAAEYRKSDIFFFPSRAEGSPKVVLEAAASGLPVIVRNDYEPETVIDGVTGYIVSSDQELFDRLGELLASRSLCHSLGRAGREHIKQFDWGGVTRQWEEVFRRVASGSN